MPDASQLKTDLEAFKSEWETRVGSDSAQLIAGDIENLRGTGILDRAAKPGTAIPPTHMRDVHNEPFDLIAHLADRPAIITFYRGGWCPYCNLELRAYNAILDDVLALGADLVAVTPETPDHSLDTSEKNDLRYTVLTDEQGALAEALGIQFTLSDDVRPYYEKAGHFLPERNGNGVWTLPIPATFVTSPGGRIAQAFIDPDYRQRTEPSAALDALRRAVNDDAA